MAPTILNCVRLLALATRGLTCEPEVCSVESPSLVQTASFAAGGAKLAAQERGEESDDVRTRPSAGGGPDIVRIGMICKAFYGLDMTAGVSTMDLVTSMNWTDSRVASIMPEGTQELTFSEDEAKARMWLPDMAITNRDIKGVDKLSSAISINAAGVVFKVDRMMVRVRVGLDSRAFPFDSQEVVVRASSSTYMSDDLVFEAVADPLKWGAEASVFKGKDLHLVNASLNVITEKTGPLEKSRAVFGLNLRRVSEAYLPTLVMPEILLLMLGNTVFFLPLLTPFVMPRVATSVIATLSVLAHKQSAVSMMPVGSSLSWISIFDEMVLFLIFSCGMFNTFVEVITHQQANPELAKKMNSELQMIMPSLSVFIIIVSFSCTGPDSVTSLAICLRTIVGLILGGYAFFGVQRTYRKDESQ